MSRRSLSSWLDRPVEPERDHILGPSSAGITLVEYGSYACPHCRTANEPIAALRDRFGDRMRYVFRHRPLPGVELARRAAELAERAPDSEQFWKAHMELMTRSDVLTEDDLQAVIRQFGLDEEEPATAEAAASRARERVEADDDGARRSGALFTPTFFINGRRYDGPWDEMSLSDAMLNTLGHRIRVAALDFVSWGPSAGVLLLLAAIIAIFLTNSPAGPSFLAFWQQTLGLALDDAAFRMSLLHWVNDGLLTIFFLVVGLEIKREFTVGHLTSRKAAAMPAAAAIGGMVVPAALYLLIVPSGPLAQGWGVPMSTDTAFAIALIAMLGRRVPVELRIFLTAAAIVDDIGAIGVVALVYSGDLAYDYLGVAGASVAALALLNRWRVYRVAPYALVGVVLWASVYQGGLHATLAGVLLALFIPTRPPANLRALTIQADAIIASEASHGRDVLRHGPSLPALQSLDAIHDRMESPAQRMLRHMGARSTYVVLPIFALANAGVVIHADVLSGQGQLMLAIMAGLVIGKPLGLTMAAMAAVAMGIAVKPEQYNWQQVAGAGFLAGIGFTMSLFIAGQALPAEADFAAAKVAVFAASVLSAVIGVLLLWRGGRNRSGEATVER